MLTFLVGLLAVLVEQKPRGERLTMLGRLGCENGMVLDGHVDRDSGFIAMLGLGERSYSFRVVRNGSRVLMVPSAQCGEVMPFESRLATFVISHAFENPQGEREGYFYLT